MRIIAGDFRGRRLKTLSGLAVRPTSDKLRETIFNILQAEVPASVFIDCYAGSGAVGLEALSRGASEVFFIEKASAAARTIQENITALGASPGRLIRTEVRAALRQLEAEGVRADLCFLDPPYKDLADALQAIEWIAQSSLMKADGRIILEHARRDTVTEHLGAGPAGWNRTRLVEQGSSALSFYRRNS